MDRFADEARFRPTVPFYLSSPDRTRESIARVFRGSHIPQRLAAFVHNEVDALLVLLSFELRLWSRAAQVGQPSLMESFEQALKGGRQDSTLDRRLSLGFVFFVLRVKAPIAKDHSRSAFAGIGSAYRRERVYLVWRISWKSPNDLRCSWTNRDSTSSRMRPANCGAP